MSYKLSRAVNELSQIIGFLYFCKSQVSYFRLSVINILKMFVSEKSESVPEFLVECAELCDEIDLRKAWNVSLSAKPLLSEKATQMLIDFGNRIGTSDTRTQLDYIDYYIREAEKLLEVAENKEKESSKLYIILGISTGVLSAIMII